VDKTQHISTCSSQAFSWSDTFAPLFYRRILISFIRVEQSFMNFVELVSVFSDEMSLFVCTYVTVDFSFILYKSLYVRGWVCTNRMLCVSELFVCGGWGINLCNGLVVSKWMEVAERERERERWGGSFQVHPSTHLSIYSIQLKINWIELNWIQFNSLQFILYSPFSQITNLPQSALQSVHIDIPVPGPQPWPIIFNGFYFEHVYLSLGPHPDEAA